MAMTLIISLYVYDYGPWPHTCIYSRERGGMRLQLD